MTLLKAPEFSEGLEWLNTERAIKLKDLRGKIVLLDFWTYCCINCMHVLPELKRLEKKYPNELVVIGVHSAKFFAERQTPNIRQAILRYDIEHPVVNDSDFKIWRSYEIRAWPTLVLIDPKGEIEYLHSGEAIYEIFDQKISELITRGRHFKNKIDRSIPQFHPEKNRDSFLLFPGKVLAIDERLSPARPLPARLFISDTNHHRIVISDFNGNVLNVVGSGKKGFSDGPLNQAEFFRPQGLAYRDGLLFVADTENHAIRKIDLGERRVTTIAGTGKQGYLFQTLSPANKISLNSPWDLTLHDNLLYIAMAGSHQIWSLDLEAGAMAVFAGTGYENIIDGLLLKSALAQPSGLATDGKRIYFADSEVSAVRAADIDPFGSVETIVGRGLFEFGDIDGISAQVRLQHPLGICYHKQKLFLADTYNHKIKVIDPVKKTCRTFAGTAEAAYRDGHLDEAAFFEPSGLSVSGRQLFVADTNNCQIRKIDLEQKVVSTVRFH